MQHVDTFEAFFNLERLLPDKSTELEEEFDFLVELAKQMIANLPSRNERDKANEWIKKLSSIKDTSEWELRNDYMKLLMYALQRPKLEGPFALYPDDDITLRPFPENRTLMQMAKEMAKTRTGPCSGDGPSVAAEASSDLKTYTAVQEIPDFGVHCFFAVSVEEPLPRWINGKNSFFPVPMDKGPDNASSVNYPWRISMSRKHKKSVCDSQSSVRTSIDIASIREIKSIDTVDKERYPEVRYFGKFGELLDPEEGMRNMEKYLQPDDSPYSNEYSFSEPAMNYWTPVRGRPRNVSVMSESPRTIQTSPRSPKRMSARSGAASESPTVSSPRVSRPTRRRYPPERSRMQSSPFQIPDFDAFDDTGDLSGEFVDSFDVWEAPRHERKRQMNEWLNRRGYFGSFLHLPPQDPEQFDFFVNPFAHELDGGLWPRDFTPGSSSSDDEIFPRRKAREQSFSLKSLKDIFK